MSNIKAQKKSRVQSGKRKIFDFLPEGKNPLTLSHLGLIGSHLNGRFWNLDFISSGVAYGQ